MRRAVFRRRGVLNWLEVVDSDSEVELTGASASGRTFFLPRVGVEGQGKEFAAMRGVFSSAVVSIIFIIIIKTEYLRLCTSNTAWEGCDSV